MPGLLSQLIQRLLDPLSRVAATDCCAVCSRVLAPGERAMCSHCLLDLPRTGSEHMRYNEIHELFDGRARPHFCTSWFRYSRASEYAALIRKAKYGDRPRLARELGSLMGRELLDAAATDPSGHAAALLAETDVLLPVPMHWRKRMRRGFNQSEEIARGLGATINVPVGDNLVARRGHKTQTRKSFDARLRNVAGTMEAVRRGELAGLGVAVVDDVVTSGATLSECVRLLQAPGPDAPPRSVSIMTLALAGHRF